MAHALPPSSGHHRRNRILGSAAVIVGIALAVVGIVALRQPEGRQASGSGPAPLPSSSASSAVRTSPSSPPTSSRPSSSAVRSPSRSRTTSAPSRPPVASVPLVVANNTGAAGLASSAAARFEVGGWRVSSLADYDGEILSTCAYFDSSDPRAEAAAVALQKQFPGIRRVKARFDGLPVGPVVVVLTSDWS